eukprot:m.745980 g.745980  ORF g.745980 m.745980 type:complete len:965 (-) comp23131_c0_seq3:64-2958(-)
MSADSLKNSATLAYRARDFDKALKLYTEAAMLDPDNMVYSLNKGAVYLEAEDFYSCVRECVEAIRLGMVTFMNLLSSKPPKERDVIVVRSAPSTAVEFSQQEKHIRSMLYKGYSRMGKALLLLNLLNDAESAFRCAVGVTLPQFAADVVRTSTENGKELHSTAHAKSSAAVATATRANSESVLCHHESSASAAGARVMLQGLSNDKYNGLLGTVTAVTADGLRLIVKLDSTGKDIRVKVQNTSNVALMGRESNDVNLTVSSVHTLANDATEPSSIPKDLARVGLASISPSAAYTVLLSAFQFSVGAEVTVAKHVPLDQKALAGLWGHIVAPSAWHSGKAAVRISSEGGHHGQEVHVRPNHLIHGHEAVEGSSTGIDTFIIGERVRLQGVTPRNFNGLEAVVLSTPDSSIVASNKDFFRVVVEVASGERGNKGCEICVERKNLCKIVGDSGTSIAPSVCSASLSTSGGSGGSGDGGTDKPRRGRRDMSGFLEKLNNVLRNDSVPLPANAMPSTAGGDTPTTGAEANGAADWSAVCEATRPRQAKDACLRSTPRGGSANADCMAAEKATVAVPTTCDTDDTLLPAPHRERLEPVGDSIPTHLAHATSHDQSLRQRRGLIGLGIESKPAGFTRTVTDADDAAEVDTPNPSADTQTPDTTLDDGDLLCGDGLGDDVDDTDFVTFEELLQQFKDEDEAKRKKKLNRKKSKLQTAQPTTNTHKDPTAAAQDPGATDIPVEAKSSVAQSKSKRKRNRKKANATKRVGAQNRDAMASKGGGIEKCQAKETAPSKSAGKSDVEPMDRQQRSHNDRPVVTTKGTLDRLPRIQRLKARHAELDQMFHDKTLTLEDMIDYEYFIQEIGNSIGGDRTRLIQESYDAQAKLCATRNPRRSELLKQQIKGYSRRELELRDEIVRVGQDVEKFYLSPTCEEHRRHAYGDNATDFLTTTAAAQIDVNRFQTQLQPCDLDSV